MKASWSTTARRPNALRPNVQQQHRNRLSPYMPSVPWNIESNRKQSAQRLRRRLKICRQRVARTARVTSAPIEITDLRAGSALEIDGSVEGFYPARSASDRKGFAFPAQQVALRD